VRGAIRDFIEVTTPYKVCDAVDDGVSAVRKATDCGCDLILLHLRMPLQDSLVTVSLLRSKLPHVKIVGFSTLLLDVGSRVSRATGFDAVLTKQDGLSKLVATLKALMPELPSGSAGGAYRPFPALG
jgi:DNA-binding NarL/FixJ family response regulator